MANEGLGLWSNLPSVIVVHIFSFLSIKDKCNASATCRAWREILFHPSLWQKIVFRVNSCDNAQNAYEEIRFIKEHCLRFIRNAVIEINSLNPRDVFCGKDILTALAKKTNLRALSLRPKSCRLEWLDSHEEHIVDQYVRELFHIIERSDALEHFSLGCVEEILDFCDCFLYMLGKCHSKNLKSLHLSMVKEYPDNYCIPDITAEMFDPFCNLEALSLDYDHISSKLLLILSEPCKKPLLHFNIHVHGIEPDKPKLSSDAWLKMKNHSPSMEVIITLLHCHENSNIMHRILDPNMPLSHFRSYFSFGLDAHFLSVLAILNNTTLQSITIVESVDDCHLPTGNLQATNGEDPLVMLAWKCNKLSSFTIIGYDVNGEDLIAIARLRGLKLKELNVPSCCVFSSEGLSQDEICHHIRSVLGEQWNFMDISELPPAVYNVNMDADGTYLEQLLRDQKW